MSQSKEQKISLLQLLAYETGSIGIRISVPILRKFFPQKKSVRLEEIFSMRLICQTVTILNGSENAEFQKIELKAGNIVITFLTSEKYAVGTKLQIALSETFDCNSEEEIIKTQWSGIVSRIQLQKKHEKYLINVTLNVTIGEE